MEGPSLVIAKENLVIFKGKTVNVISGNTKIGKERLLNKKVYDIFSWGKHLVFQFDNFGMRIHFMLYGTYEATVNGKTLTGEYTKKSKEPRLFLEFENGNINFYNCSIKFIEGKDIKTTYDFSIDIMSKEWNSKKTFEKVIENKREEIVDVLLDQEIFAGVGNIIKNEVLFLTKINPKTLISKISNKKLQEIINVAQEFSQQFYAWRKQFKLKANLKIYRKSFCPICNAKVIRQKTGKRERFSFYCPACQK